MKQILLRGPPGVGKSTLGKLLQSQLPSSCFVSSGSLLRQHSDPSLRRSIGKGELANSETVLAIMRNEWNRLQYLDWMIIDGFPRKLPELEQWIKLTTKPHLVVYMHAEEGTIVNKLVNRRICNHCGKNYNLFSSSTMHAILPRISGECDACNSGLIVQREDDYESTVRRRLMTHRENERSIEEFMISNGVSMLHATVSTIHNYSKLAREISKELQ